MESQRGSALPEPNHQQAVEHITEAHKILSRLQQEASQHAAMGEAVREAVQRLEMALAILSVKTGGML